MIVRKLTATIAIAAALTVGTAGAALAADSTPSTPVVLTSTQLAEDGFPTAPSKAASDWNARLSATSAKVGTALTIVGKAPKYVKQGTVITLGRFVPTDTKGSGTFTAIPATAKVGKGGLFKMKAVLDRPGTFGYRVGYETTSASPEFVGFQFQFTNTK